MQNTMRDPDIHATLSKVPMVTLGFWIIKILATTLGETGGDAVTMTWLGETTKDANPNGYLIGTAIFFSVLLALVAIRSWPNGFIHSCIGRRSSHRPRPARRWRISAPVPLGSVISADRPFFSHW